MRLVRRGTLPSAVALLVVAVGIPEIARAQTAESWTITARVEGGWTYVPTFGGFPSVSPPPRWALMDSGPTGGGGVRFRRKMGDIVSFVADAGIRVVFVDTDDVTGSQGNVAEGFDTATALPVSIGLEVRF